MNDQKLLRDIIEKINNIKFKKNKIDVCSYHQSVQLSKLGITLDATKEYHDVLIHLCVNNNVIPEYERQYYTSHKTQDAYGFDIEVLIQESESFVGYLSLAALDQVIEEKSKLINEDCIGKDSFILEEEASYQAYSEANLLVMLDKIGWTMDTIGVDSASKNQAEVLADTLIKMLQILSNPVPVQPKIIFNHEKANYTSPEYLARKAKVEAGAKEQSMARKGYIGKNNCNCKSKGLCIHCMKKY